MNKHQVKDWIRDAKELIKNIISKAFGNNNLIRKINFLSRNRKIKKNFPQLCLPKPLVVITDEA